jgi:hypothetical protein
MEINKQLNTTLEMNHQSMTIIKINKQQIKYKI